MTLPVNLAKKKKANAVYQREMGKPLPNSDKAMQIALESFLKEWNARALAQSAGGGEARIERDDWVTLKAKVFTIQREKGTAEIAIVGVRGFHATTIEALSPARTIITDTAREGVEAVTGYYRKKRSVVIEAWQWNHEREGELRGVCNCHLGNWGSHLHTAHEGQIVQLSKGDWIIPEPDGEHYYPCKPDIFAATYEPAAPSNVGTGEADLGIASGWIDPDDCEETP